MLLTDDERLTSLLGGSGGVDVGNMGVVEPVCEKVPEAFECDTKAESGPGLDGWLESCENDDNRFSQVDECVLSDAHPDASLARSPPLALVLAPPPCSWLIFVSSRELVFLFSGLVTFPDEPVRT